VCNNNLASSRVIRKVKEVITKILELQEVTKSFAGVAAVNKVNIYLKEGEILAVIGPNGAGKTTLFNLITNIYHLDYGQIYFKGRNITNYPTHLISRLGIARTFQNLRLLEGLSVLDNVFSAFYVSMKSTKISCLFHTGRYKREVEYFKQRALELLEESGIKEKASYEAGSLPYADQKLLEIARALGTEPKVLLLDEPTSGISSTESEELINYLFKLREKGLSIIVIGHHMRFIMKICDRIVVLNQGYKIAEGTPEHIQNDEGVIRAYLGGEQNV